MPAWRGSDHCYLTTAGAAGGVRAEGTRGAGEPRGGRGQEPREEDRRAGVTLSQ